MKLVISILFLFSLGAISQECTDCNRPKGAIERFITSVERLLDPTSGLEKAQGMTLCLLNPDANPLNGGWGHWWIEISEQESYGWWAAESFGKNISPADLQRVMVGVEGELNGQSLYGGSLTQDPKHGDRPEGVVTYDIYVPEGLTLEQLKQQIRDFANGYRGGWSWPRGPNCHTFIKEMLETLDLEIKRRHE